MVRAKSVENERCDVMVVRSFSVPVLKRGTTTGSTALTIISVLTILFLYSPQRVKIDHNSGNGHSCTTTTQTLSRIAMRRCFPNNNVANVRFANDSLEWRGDE